jgi:hypothetical protein
MSLIHLKQLIDLAESDPEYEVRIEERPVMATVGAVYSKPAYMVTLIPKADVADNWQSIWKKK